MPADYLGCAQNRDYGLLQYYADLGFCLERVKQKDSPIILITWRNLLICRFIAWVGNSLTWDGLWYNITQYTYQWPSWIRRIGKPKVVFLACFASSYVLTIPMVPQYSVRSKTAKKWRILPCLAFYSYLFFSLGLMGFILDLLLLVADSFLDLSSLREEWTAKGRENKEKTNNIYPYSVSPDQDHGLHTTQDLKPRLEYEKRF